MLLDEIKDYCTINIKAMETMAIPAEKRAGDDVGQAYFQGKVQALKEVLKFVTNPVYRKNND